MRVRPRLMRRLAARSWHVDARASFRELLRRDANAAVVWNNLGLVLAESERPADAFPYFERFQREAPRSSYAADLAHVERVVRSLRR